jgi:hypothetical protein
MLLGPQSTQISAGDAQFSPGIGDIDRVPALAEHDRCGFHRRRDLAQGPKTGRGDTRQLVIFPIPHYGGG